LIVHSAHQTLVSNTADRACRPCVRAFKSLTFLAWLRQPPAHPLWRYGTVVMPIRAARENQPAPAYRFPSLPVFSFQAAGLLRSKIKGKFKIVGLCPTPRWGLVPRPLLWRVFIGGFAFVASCLV
jgi:hypothetical protein